MGQGTITGSNDALYTITVDYGTAAANQQVTLLQTRKAQLEAQITDAENSLVVQEANKLTLSANLNAAIDQYNLNEQADKEPVKDATAALAANAILVDKTKNTLARLRLNLANVDSDLAEIQSVDLSETKQAWCVDYTPNATGIVETIEINAEQPQVLIAPGAPAYTTAAGGMTAREIQAGFQAFYNVAILPGWQKFKPTYRTGHITAIDRFNDTCDVTLDAAYSSAQGLSINQTGTLSDVPIEYMTCNAGAFDVGDDVVVQFVSQDWEQPKVIGFVSNPKVCGPARFFFFIEVKHTRVTTATASTPSYWQGVLDSEVITNPDPTGVRLTRTVRTYSTTDAFGTNQNTVTAGAEHESVRVRFDVAWSQEYEEDTLFQKIDAPTIVDAGPYFDSDPTVVPLMYQEFSFFRDRVTPWTVGSGERCWLNIEQEVICESPVDIVGGVSTTENYVLTSANYFDIDYAHAHAWVAARYELPPDEITIEINGADVKYRLETFGPGRNLPQNPPEDIPVASPPTGGGNNPLITAVYTVNNPRFSPGATYIRSDLYQG